MYKLLSYLYRAVYRFYCGRKIIAPEFIWETCQRDFRIIFFFFKNFLKKKKKKKICRNGQKKNRPKRRKTAKNGQFCKKKFLNFGQNC